MLRADFESYAGAWRAARATLRNGLRHAGAPAGDGENGSFQGDPLVADPRGRTDDNRRQLGRPVHLDLDVPEPRALEASRCCLLPMES